MMKLLIPLATAAAIRIFIAFPHVLNPIRFASPDSYYYAMLARDGTQDFYGTMLGWITALLPFNNEKELLAVPIVLTLLTVIAVYVITSITWDRKAGFWAAMVVAVLPGEYLGRTIMGNVDHHAAEVLFSTVAIAFLFVWLTAGDRKTRMFGIAGTLMFGAVYTQVWTGYILFYGLVVLFAAFKFWQRFGRTWQRAILIAILSIATISATRFIPNIDSMIFAVTNEALPLLGASPPLFSIVMAFLAVIGIILCAVDYHAIRDDKLLFIILWAVMMLAATLIMRRFAYYLAIPTGILIGYSIVYWVDRIRLQRAVLAGTVAILLFMGLYSFRSLPVPSPAWLDALAWVNEHTPADATITANWDYGYWIRYETNRKVIADPNQNPDSVRLIAELLTTEHPASIWNSTEYLLLDYPTLNGKYAAVEAWAGRPGTNAAVKDIWIESGRLVYGNDEIKIFKGNK